MKADEIAARRAKVATAILEHKTQREVAAELGLTLGTVNSDIKATRREWQAHRLDALDHAAAEDLRRLSEVEKVLWPKVIDCDLHAIDRWVKIRQERAKLLGLDAPTKIDLVGIMRRLAEEEGLDPDEAVAEVERIYSRYSSAGR